MTLDEIEGRAQALAEHRARLAGLVGVLQAGIQALREDHLPGIRQAVGEASAAWEALRAAIEAAPELFASPRTRVLHGIKLGYQKGKGGLEIADPQRTVELIEKHLPESFETLVLIKRMPFKDALARLPGAQLKKLGVNLVESGDQIVIRPSDSDVDAFVRQMIDAELEKLNAQIDDAVSGGAK